MIAPNSQPGTNGRHALEGALDAVPVGVVLFDPSGRPMVTSRAAREMLGDVVTRPLERWPESGTFLDPSGARLLAADFPPLQTLRDGAPRMEIEVGVECPDGAVTPVLMCSRGVLDTDGEVVQVALAVTPLVAQSRRRSKERMAERFDAIGALTASVAGPLNDALTAIAGYCELARTNLQDGDPVQAVVSEIRQASHRVTVLTGRLLAHGRQEVPVTRVLDLDRWLATRVTALDALLGDGIRLELSPGAEGHLVEIDTRLLEQALADVLANAREAMPDGGCVRVSTTAPDPRRAHGNSHELNLLGEGPGRERTVVLTVTDTGGGIAEPVLRRIFEPFFTTKPGALGLGLATVERLLRLQGGEVGVQNHRGKGVSFQLHLKPAPANATESPAWERPERTPRRGPSVLVVEDDEFVRELVVEVLQRERYQVLEARNPADATRLLERTENVPDLLISDLCMPGETGGTLASRLQEQFPDLLVLFVSGACDPSTLAGSFEEGRTAFLAKPFVPESLLACVSDLLVDKLADLETPPEPAAIPEPVEPEAEPTEDPAEEQSPPEEETLEGLAEQCLSALEDEECLSILKEEEDPSVLREEEDPSVLEDLDDSDGETSVVPPVVQPIAPPPPRADAPSPTRPTETVKREVTSPPPLRPPVPPGPVTLRPSV